MTAARSQLVDVNVNRYCQSIYRCGPFCAARDLNTASSGSKTAGRRSPSASPRASAVSRSCATTCTSWCGWSQIPQTGGRPRMFVRRWLVTNESRHQPISARDWLGSKRSIGPKPSCRGGSRNIWPGKLPRWPCPPPPQPAAGGIEKDATLDEATHSAALDAAFAQELDRRADTHVVQRRGGCKTVQPLVQLLGIVGASDRGTHRCGYVPEPPFQLAEQSFLAFLERAFFL